MPNMDKETHFVMRNGKAEYPSVAQENLLAWYDAKGKHNPDRHKDTLLDLSGNNRHAELYNFAYEKKSGYLDNPEGGLLFDDVDDKLVYPSVKDEVEYTSASRNQLPSFSSGLWTLSGGATISGNTLTIPREGAFATIYMPWDGSDTKIRISALYSSSPLINTRYFDDEGSQIGSNGWTNDSVALTDRAYGSLPYDESQGDLTKTKTIRVQLTTGSITTLPYTVTDMMLTANSYGNIPYTPYVPLPVMTYQYNGNILSYEADGTVKRVDDGKVIARKGINLVRNGNFSGGLNGWTLNNSYVKSLDKGIELTRGSDAGYNGLWIGRYTQYPIGHKIYRSVELISYGTPKYIRIRSFNTNIGDVSVGSPIEGKLYRLEDIVSIVDDTNKLLLFATEWENSNVDMRLVVNKAQIIDLTEAYGAGNEPTLEYIQAHPEEFAWTPNPNDLIEAHEIKNNLVGDLEDLHGTGDKTEILSGVGEVFTDQADDDSIVHVELEGKSVQSHRFREESGASLVLTNHAEDKPRKLEVLGSTFQNAGSGKNLVVSSGNYKSDMKITDTYWKVLNPSLWNTSFHDGFIRFEKLTTDKSSWVVLPLTQNLEVGKQYTFTIKYRRSTSNGTPFYISSTDSGTGTFSSFTHGTQIPNEWTVRTEQIPIDGSNYKYLFFTSSHFLTIGETIDIEYIQIEEGSTATAYEPPAPSPDYPIEMKNVGEGLELVSGIGGRNLLNISMLGGASQDRSVTAFTLSSWASAALRKEWVSDKLKPNTHYTMSYKVRMLKKTTTYNSDVRLGRFLLFGGGTAIQMGSLTKEQYEVMNNNDVQSVTGTFKTPADLTGSSVLVYTALVDGVTASMRFEDIKIEEGSTATPYTPAPEDVPLNTIQNDVFRTKPNLTEPLRKVGDVADRLFWDATAGKWKVERRVGEIEIVTKGHSWTWLKGVSSNPDYYYFYRTQDSLGMTGGRRRIYSVISPLKSNRLKVLSPRPYASVSEEAIVPWSDLTSFIFVLHKIRLGELTDANINAWFEANPTTILYELETPVIETLEGGQLPPLFSPTTYLDAISEVKGQLTAGYRLKEGVAPETSDILVAPEYVNPIHSVDKVDVVSSVGRRNLIHKGMPIVSRIDALTGYGGAEYEIIPNGFKVRNRWSSFGWKLKVSPNTEMMISGNCKIENSIGNARILIGINRNINSSAKNQRLIATELDEEGNFSVTFTSNSSSSENVIAIGTNSDVGAPDTLFKITNIKLVKGAKTTTYTPAPEDIQPDTYIPTLYKTNLLLSEPLRSVGNVKDRLFRDSDGLWKIERKIGKVVYNGSENWKHSDNGLINTFRVSAPISNGKISAIGYSDKVRWITGGTSNDDSENAQISADSVFLRINNNRLGLGNRTIAAKEWLALNPVTFQYELATPTLETLPQADQDKLNNLATYAGSNYVYTVLPDKDTSLAEQLQPTIHAKFRKLSWFWSRLLFNQLKIWRRNLTDSELLHEWKQNKKRWGM